MKSECTGSKSGRHIFRSFFQEYIDRAKAYHETEACQKSMRKRAAWVEPLFGEAKQFHQLRRFRLRGLMKVNIERVMVAAGQNLKRLLKKKMQEILVEPSEKGQSASTRFSFIVVRSPQLHGSVREGKRGPQRRRVKQNLDWLWSSLEDINRL